MNGRKPSVLSSENELSSGVKRVHKIPGDVHALNTEFDIIHRIYGAVR